MDFLISLIASTVRLAVPILLPALGEIYSERAGVLNLGLEGVMLVGALFGFAGGFFFESIWLGILCGIVAGVLVNLIMAYWTVTLGVNQVIAGFAITIMGGGLSVFLYRVIFGVRSVPPSVTPPAPLHIPLLSDIPILGPMFFQHSPLIYLAYLLVPLAAIVLYRTKFGLLVRAAGENPAAIDTRGKSVFAIRYAALLISGATAGFAGAFLSIGSQGSFIPDMTAGRGFIALAVVVLARWNPLHAVWASLLFGGAYALQLRLQTMDAPVPHQLLLALPYVLTLLVLIGVSRGAGVPAALTIPYSRAEKR